VKQNIALKHKKLRTQINGKFNDRSSANENIRNVTVEPSFKNYKNTVYLCNGRRL
jgi:hypothetical protein